MKDNQSKIHNYGNEKESSWPSQFGTGEKGVFHLDQGEVKEGYPPPRHEKLGNAPMVIFDSMPETYHHGACRPVESRKEWERLDKETGCITFGSKESAKPKTSEYRQKEEYRKMIRKAGLEAIKKYEDNPTLVKQKVAHDTEKQYQLLERNGLKHLIEE